MKLCCAIHPEATEGAYGRLVLEPVACRPLDIVTVRVEGRSKRDKQARIRVCDAEQQLYYEETITLRDNRGRARFAASGTLGAHYVYLYWPDRERHSRYSNFQVDCQTQVESGDAAIDGLYALTRDAMRRGRRDYDTAAGRFVGYMSADTLHFDGIWLRDWLYGLPAYRHWETQMTCGLDRFLERQDEPGMIPDGIERDGRTWRVGLESDVEYILTLGVWETWRATGDDGWLADVLPRLERALNYVRNSSRHWDAERQLVKRQHSCDTWDFDINGASDKGDQRYVTAVCDQSGYALAFAAMSLMHARLKNDAAAARWQAEAEAYRRRANDLLWDGTKYLHHVHIDEIDHGDFDESEQLAMGNVWALTRGLADSDQARRVVDEYRRRHMRTGDAYPWWSLQPGYPDCLGYFKEPFLRQGGYANGGLMPWVGGELCRAAFACGREGYGVALLRQYLDHLARTGGAQVWYWPNGMPGFRTQNEVPYAGWGMAEWLNAALEGLAGVRDDEGLMRSVTLSPRWPWADVSAARVQVRYAASKACVAYAFRLCEDESRIELTCTGSGRQARVRIPLPDDWPGVAVGVDGKDVESALEVEDASRYACFTVSLAGVRNIALTRQT
jgi:hypothetical protein